MSKRASSTRTGTPFEEIRREALIRLGGEATLAERLPVPKTPAELRAVPDDRYLSRMSFRIFAAGLKHSMVEAKWPAFEEAFHGFLPKRVAAMHDEELEALMQDRRLIRHWGKIRSVPANAAAMLEIAAEHGSFGTWLADWPGDDITGLWQDLGKRFSQLGGMSGAYFLRMVGKDSFVPTPYVLRALRHWGRYDGSGKGKAEQRRLQAAFNALAGETGLPLCQLSMTLAASID